MSTRIDEQVVEMRFDNRHFEKNVSHTMSSLDKLKQKLNFSNAHKSLEGVSTAAKKVDMRGLAGSVDTVHAKFSALQVMGVTALANITNSAVNAGKRIVSALTIDPVKSGFNEYELKMGSIQTIMAGTGESLETVNKYLNELNEYSDKTIYSFQDMTSNIGKFTNAGVKLEDAVAAIKGISNEAAISGANANEASRAMYNFSQALSSGYVKLIDWKSIENANMATMEFKQQLIDTALALGTVTKSSDGMYKTLSGKTFNATQNFNDVLQEQWMTSEVLIETLKDYADENTEIGKKASEAATKVKTLTQLWDTLKESAQSGWAQTWEIIVGDFEEARTLFTKISDVIGGIIGDSAERRNNLLKGALGDRTDWSKMIKTLEQAGLVTDRFKFTVKKLAKENGIAIDDLIKEHGSFNKVIAAGKIPMNIIKEALKGFVGVEKEAAKTTEDITDKLKYFEDMVTRVVRGEFGNGEERVKALTEAGHNYAEVQQLVNECWKDGKLDLSKITREQLVNMGYTEQQAEAVKKLADESGEAGVTIEDLMKKLEKPSGRTLLIESVKNAAYGLGRILKSVGEAWGSIFAPVTSDQLYGIIEAIHKFSEKLRMGGETARKVTSIFRGLFAVLDIVLTFLRGGIGIAFKIVNGLLEAFGTDILTVAAYAGEALVTFRDWIHNVLDFTKIFEFFVPIVKNAANAIKDWFAGFKDTKAFQNIVSVFNTASESLLNWITSLKESENLPRDIIAGLVKGLWTGIKTVGQAVMGLATYLIDTFKNLLGIHSPSTVFIAIGGFIIAGLITGLTKGFDQVGSVFTDLWGIVSSSISKILDFIKNIDLGAVFSGALLVGSLVIIGRLIKVLDNITSPLGEFADVLGAAEGALKSFSFNLKAKAIKDIAISIAILAGSVAVLALLPVGKMWSAVGAIAVLSLVLIGLSFAMDKMNKASVDLKKGEISGLTSGLVGVGIAILAIAATVKLLGSLDADQAKQGFLGLAGICAGILVFVGIYGKLVKGKAAQNMDKAGVMLRKLATSILLLTLVAKLIAGMSWGDMGKAAAGIAGLGIIIAGLVWATKLAGKNIDKVGGTILKISVAIGLLVLVAKMIAGMSEEDLEKGVYGISKFGGIITGLIFIVSLVGKDFAKVGSTILAVSVSIGLLVLVAKMIAGMDIGTLIKGIAGVAAFGLIVMGLIKAVKMVGGEQAEGIGKTILAVAGAIAILAAVATLMGFMSIEHLAKGIIAVGILSIIMMGLIKATKGAQSCVGNLIVMTIAIGLMAASIAALSFIDEKKLLTASLAMGLMMGLFAVMIKTSEHANASIKSLITMTVAMGLLAGLLYLLSGLKTEMSIENALALSALMLAMSAVLLILSNIQISVGNALKGILGLTLMAVPLLAFVGVLALMQNIENAISNANVLIKLATVMTLLMLPLTLIGALWIPALIGIGALTLMAVPLLAFVGVLALMENVQNAVTNANTLIRLTTAMTLLMIPLTLIGALWPAALLGIGALTVAIVAIGALVVGVGALMEKFPALQSFIDTGIPVLERLAEGIGSMIGKFIAGLAEGILDSLPGIADKLSDFMTRLQPFIDGAKTFDSSLVDNVKSLISTISDMTKTSILDGITKWFQNKSTLSDFADELSDFCDKVSGIDSGAVNSASESVLKIVDVIKKAEAVDSSAAEGFKDALEDLGESSVDEFVKAFTSSSAKSDVKSAAKKLLDTFTEAVEDKKSKVTKKFKTVASDSADAIEDKYSSFKDAGKYLVDGFVKGIDVNTYKAAAKARAMAKAADEAARDELGIESPAKKGIEIGGFFGEGLLVGMANKIPEAYAGGKMLAASANEGLADGIAPNENLKKSFAEVEKEAKAYAANLAKAAKEGVEEETEKENLFTSIGNWLMGNKKDNSESGISKAVNGIKEKITGGLEGTVNGIKEKITGGLEGASDKAATSASSGASKAVAKAKVKLTEAGEYIVENITSGISSETSAEEAIQIKARNIASAFQEEFSKLDLDDETQNLENELKTDKALDKTATNAKKVEHQITRVALAQAEYNITLKEFGSAAEETQSAYNKLLQEQIDLEDLKHEGELINYNHSLEWIEKKKKANDLSLIEELAAYRRMQSAYKEGSDERIAIDEEVLRVQKEITDATEQYYKDVDELHKEYTDKKKAREEEYTDLVKSKTKEIADSYGIFDAVKEQEKVDPDDILKNSKDQVKALEDWQANLADLQTRETAVPKELLEELYNMGPEGNAYLDALSKMSESQFGTFVDNWKEKMFIAGKSAEFQLVPEKEEMEEELTELDKELDEKLGKIKETYDKTLGLMKEETESQFTTLIKENIETVGDEEKWSEAGANIIEGIIKGITLNSSMLNVAVANAMSSALTTAKNTLGIESPSKEFEKLGKFSDQGFARGLSKFSSIIDVEAASLGNNAIDSLKNAVSHISDVVNNDMDTQPTIRPIVDLSNVRSGARTIGELFGSGASVGVLANVGSLSSTMNRRNQNGANYDIVSAIDKLRGEMSESRGNTYNINGIDYSESSDVGEAIKTIIRAAKVERRT